MLRIVAPLFRAAGSARAAAVNAGNLNICRIGVSLTHLRCLGSFVNGFRRPWDEIRLEKPTLFSEPMSGMILPAAVQPIDSSARTLTKFSLRSGKRKTVKAVIKRFYRLHWGCWIRTKTGRHKKLWKKSSAQKRRLRQHVFVNGTQSWLLDKMVTNYWRRPRHYIDDPYTPYHTREEFFLTRKKPAL